MGGGGGQSKNPTSRGFIDTPLPPGPDQDANEYCIKLPWKRIVEEVDAASDPDPGGVKADFSLAADPANVKWELGAWYNLNRPDDLITGMPEATYTCVNVTDVVPNDENWFAAEGTDGGDCHKLQGKFHCCLDQKSGGSTCDAATCGALTAGGQAGCEAAGCIWNASGLPAPGQCVSAVCNADQDFSGRVTGADLAVLKKDLGRVTTCPCGQ
jgi:hypothetical protein